MNKTQLLARVSAETGVSQVLANKVISATTEAIKKSLSDGDAVRLVGFGTFKVSQRKARVGVNPQTGKKINIPSRKSVRFLSGKATKEAVN
jgi:nucleoid DNA-binding protein